MNNQFIFLFGIDNRYPLISLLNVSRIANLSATFGIERCTVKHQLKQFLILLNQLAVFHNLYIGFQEIVADEFSFFIFTYQNPVTGFLGRIRFGALFLFLHFSLKSFLINRKTLFAGYERSEVE